ncbi:hypothetical protein AGMMS49587_03790 [Spirochaetia bacterium]|nr:hypothetical protein AGMMS49587_03790 [Spirochaetia bacterium]
MKNTIEADLDKIRMKLYEQTKHLHGAEMTAYLKKLSAPVLKEYSIRTVHDETPASALAPDAV